MRFAGIIGIVLLLVLVIGFMSLSSAVVSIGKLAFYAGLLLVLGVASAFLWAKRRM